MQKVTYEVTPEMSAMTDNNTTPFMPGDTIKVDSSDPNKRGIFLVCVRMSGAYGVYMRTPPDTYWTQGFTRLSDLVGCKLTLVNHLDPNESPRPNLDY